MVESAKNNAADRANKLKDEGNEAFKEEKYETAIELYTEAIKCSDDTPEKSVYYKNRAAAYLKLKLYDNVVEDCTKALQITPRDPKALFRRCQALEELERFEEAYRDAVEVLKSESTNKAIQPVLARLNDIVQRRHLENNLLSNKVKKMLEIAFDNNADNEKRETAFNNLLVLAREKAGSEQMWENNIMPKLVSTIKVDKNESRWLTSVRIMSELLKSHVPRVKEVLKKFGVPWFIDILDSKQEERVNAVQYCLQTILNTLSGLENKPDSKPVKELCDENKSEIETLLTCLVMITTSRTLSGLARDAVIELIARNVHYTVLNWADRFVEIKGLYRLLEVASELQEYKYESSMEITNNTRNTVAVCLTRIYDNMYYDQARQRYFDSVDEFLKEKLLDSGMESKVRAVVAITTLLLGPLDVGNTVVAKEGIMEMILAMASTDDILQQKVACECIIAASSKKDKITAIVKNGANILKKLYTSKDDSIRIRALVGLCKLGASGGTDASIRPFAEGATNKLAEACRKFLVNPAKDGEMRRWAAEGLSYLTLDAEVKEKLIEDRTALHALMDLAKNGDSNSVYGIVTTFVNLANAYAKQEIMPEMLELAKFAKHHVPEDHVLDDPDFVAKRLEILANEGITSALVTLSKTESRNSKELICRIFNALCSQQNLRGLVVQQGGVKVLLQMALEGTDNGKKQAAQALARIGITINPEVAFPGQRMLEVIRPLINLLHPECSALENFESLLALCNLASVSDNVRKRIIKDNGLNKIESYMFEDHTMLKRAATQVMVNMITEESVVKIYEDKNDRTKYLFLLCYEDDDATVEAASGALAMLTEISPKCCHKLFTCDDWLTIFQSLLSDENIGIKLRAAVIVRNVINASEELAQKLIETNILEILMSLNKFEDKRLVEVTGEALKAAEEMKLIRKRSESDSAQKSNGADDNPDIPDIE